MDLIVGFVTTAVEVVPALLRIPWLGRILLPFINYPDNQAKAIEQLQRLSDQHKQTRTRAKERNNKNVIKVSDAIGCVEGPLADGALVWELAKNLGRVVTGTSNIGVDEIVMNRIIQCFEEKMLRHDTPRIASSERRYHRPSRGHGHGRRNFG